MGRFLDALGKVAGTVIAAGVTTASGAIKKGEDAECLKPEYRALTTERLVEIVKARRGFFDPKALAATSILKERGWEPSSN